MAQLMILGPVIYYTVRPGRVSEVVRIDAATATAVLELLGHSPAVAILVAHHALTAEAARRLGAQLGLISASCEA